MSITTTHVEQKSKSAIRAYLGGSFNPVHNGHIKMAMAVYNSLAPIASEQQRKLQVSLLPNARSPFKEQSLDPKQRLAMLMLAVQNTPLQISELELWQTPPVYTIDSVRTLRAKYPRDTLIFIMGMDSARSLAKWKNGLQLTDYVNLWIFDRSDNLDSSSTLQTMQTNNENPLTAQPLDKLILQLPIELQQQVTESVTDLVALASEPLPNAQNAQSCQPLKKSRQGRIYIDQRSVLNVSSTKIRKQLSVQLQQPFNKQFNQQLATTAINLNNPSNNLTKWLNLSVYHYIIDHRLYSAAQFR